MSRVEVEVPRALLDLNWERSRAYRCNMTETEYNQVLSLINVLTVVVPVTVVSEWTAGVNMGVQASDRNDPDLGCAEFKISGPRATDECVLVTKVFLAECCYQLIRGKAANDSLPGAYANARWFRDAIKEKLS